MSDQEKNGTESAEHGHHEHGHHEHGHHEHGSHEHGSHGCWHHGEGHHPRGKHCGREGDWWSERALSQKILIGIGFGILGLVFISFIGWVTMTLWNRLMPQIFGWGRIGYWQAWGLLILSLYLLQELRRLRRQSAE